MSLFFVSLFLLVFFPVRYGDPTRRQDVLCEWLTDRLGATRPTPSADGAAQTFSNVLYTFKDHIPKAVY